MPFSLLAALTLLIPVPDTTGIRIEVSPLNPHIEQREGQALNFDFLIENLSTDTVELIGVEVTVKDRRNGIVLRRFLDNNGFSPSILTIPQRQWAPRAKHLVFNPFHTFAESHDLFSLTFDFRFNRRGEKTAVVETVVVHPKPFAHRTELILPVEGLLLVWDGHDFYSHHRRFDFLHPAAQQFGFRRNFMRYAYDFVRVDSAGGMQRDGASGNEKYYGFGEPVLAPGSGVVTAVGNAQPDNREGEDFFDPMKLVDNPMGLYGNYVVIDHGNNEFSLLGHLRQGSVIVKVGDRVQQGARVAQVGSSGSSYFPHVHYELRTGSTLMVEGLPSYFRSFERVAGNRVTQGKDAIDTGDLVRTTIPGGSK